MKTNHEHIQTSGVQKPTTILHLGSLNSGGMAGAQEEAHKHPRPLLTFSKGEGIPKLPCPTIVSLNPGGNSGQSMEGHELHIWGYRLLAEASPLGIVRLWGIKRKKPCYIGNES